MHPFLLNHDLITIVFRYLRESVDYSTLLALALSCKDLSEPALDAIWYSIPDLVPLLKLLPEDLLETTRGTTPNFPQLRLKRTPVPPDWDRVLSHYAHRVRVVGYRDVFEHPTIDTSLIMSLPSLHLLPNAQEVTLSFSNTSPYQTFRSMINPYVQIIRIHFIYNTTPSPLSPPATLLAYIRHTCKYIKTVEFHFSEHSHTPDITTATNENLDDMRHLRDLRTSVRRGDSFTSIATIPRLQILRLSIIRPIQGTWVEWLGTNLSNASTQLFPSIRVLLLTSTNVEACSQFLSVFTSTLETSPIKSASQLTTLLLYLSPSIKDTAEYWEFVTPLIGDIPSLTTLILRDDSEDPPFHVRVTIRGEIFGPLCSLTNLRRFRFVSSYPISLDTPSLHRMATSWPHLEDLRIETLSKKNINHMECPSLSVLRTFANNCPNLSSFACRMDAMIDPSSVGSDDSRSGEGDMVVRPHARPITLSFLGSSHITDPSTVAKFITKTFWKPSIENESTKSLKEWSAVSRICKRAVDARSPRQGV